jgi:hypothetical protein
MMVIQIANYPDQLGFSGKFLENLQNKFALKLLVIGSSTVQCYGSRTSNQTWSKGLDAGTYCKK